MHQGLYSAVVRSLQLYDRLQSHASTAASTPSPPTSSKTQVLGSAVCLLTRHDMSLLHKA